MRNDHRRSGDRYRHFADTQQAITSTHLRAFDAKTIHDLFGSFDAEREETSKFEQYFVTNDFYKSFTADFPLRVAIGNKGTGKSAILRASLLEEQKQPESICVALSASELVAHAENLPADSLRAINHWKAVFAREALANIFTTSITDRADVEAAKSFSSLSRFVTWAAGLASKASKGATDLVIKSGLDITSVKKIVFFIDDLDKGWDGRYEGLHFVNSILNACYDLTKREPNFRFRLAIRWDLWDAISRVNQDIDKIRQNAVFLRWTNHEIYLIVANRVARFFNSSFPYHLYLEEERNQEEVARIFDPVIDRTFQGLGKWDGTPTRRVLLSMTRNRPRDLINLLTLAAEEANKKGRVKINSNDLKAIFPRYSEERLSDLSVEYGTRLHGMDALLLSFKPSKKTAKAAASFRYTNDQMSTHIKTFLRDQGGKIRFATEKYPPDFRRILDFLYRIDFLSAWFTNERGATERVAFQDRQLAVSGLAEFGYSWEVLPAYRWGIQPTNLNEVIASLDG